MKENIAARRGQFNLMATSFMPVMLTPFLYVCHVE